MQVGQLLVGIGVGVGLTAGSIGGWTAFQRLSNPSGQSIAPAATQPVDYSQPANSQPANGQTVILPGSNAANRTALVSLEPQSPAANLTQAANDYLYDLSQSLQAREQRRITDVEKLAIGQQIAAWLEDGSDYWQVRSLFDQAYRGSIAGDYGHNREVYIKFATARFAPQFVATLMPPPPPPEVIVETRYIEIPSEPEVVTVPQPYPVPVPGNHYPDRPNHPHPWPDRPDHPDSPDPGDHPDDSDHANHPDYPDWPNHPDHPDSPDQAEATEHPGQAENPAPPPAEVDQTQEPEVIAAEPDPEPVQPELPVIVGQDIGGQNAGGQNIGGQNIGGENAGGQNAGG